MSDDAPRGNPGLDPDDLDISKSEYVRELGDDRYVVSPGRRPPRQPREEEPDDGSADAGDDAPEIDAAATAEAAREGLSPDDGPSATADPAGTSTDAPGTTADTAADAVSPGRAGPGSGTAGTTDATPAADPSTPDGAADGLPTDPTGTADTDAGAGQAGTRDRPASHARRGAPRGDAVGDTSSGELDAGAVGQWLAASLADTEFAYGFDATLSLDGRTARHRMASDDVAETFETLVTWFADAAGGDTPPQEALGILLSNMESGPRVPPDAVRRALARLGMSRDDTMTDLLAALDREDGLEL
ncbi:DUF7500 family protein [Halobaculum marinum]|uniref:Uncharacterized protein n=1 Tax=Halobaculum marinum TaxID=3031996 RepID=A0ABD5WYJ3_9EURY|nr:hypothetical protein [Halobaculum sp. DT55]